MIQSRPSLKPQPNELGFFMGGLAVFSKAENGVIS